MIHGTLVQLINRLEDASAIDADIIRWSSPVLSFGDPQRAKIATLGINPSNREFVDSRGLELHGPLRRFHTLASLGLSAWSWVESRHLQLMLESYRHYFERNPYNRWFRVLDVLLQAGGASYYDPRSPACHLDLVPYTTASKWTTLSRSQRDLLLDLAGDSLGSLLRDSRVELIIVNGRSVVEQLQRLAGTVFLPVARPGWDLARAGGEDVAGVGFMGEIHQILGIALERRIRVLGYNHNLQSSFGITSAVSRSIAAWIRRESTR
jgi:hypothetical protein